MMIVENLMVLVYSTHITNRIILKLIFSDFFHTLELGQSTVKCMRGILECWIKQAHRVELFKQRQSNQHALHCKFHLHTGEVYLIEFYLCS